MPKIKIAIENGKDLILFVNENQIPALETILQSSSVVCEYDVIHNTYSLTKQPSSRNWKRNTNISKKGMMELIYANKVYLSHLNNSGNIFEEGLKIYYSLCRQVDKPFDGSTGLITVQDIADAIKLGEKKLEEFYKDN